MERSANQQMDESMAEDDAMSNDSDPDRLEIEDRDEEEPAESEEADENGYDMSMPVKRCKVDSGIGEANRPGSSSPNTANISPINRMDTPESNCSDSQVDQETTKLWQALAR